MKNSLKNSQAFSLIELSIVVLIIGILIAGVVQGSRLVKQSKLRTARNQTQNSPVNSISGLFIWWETTMENSVISASNNINPEDGDKISTLNDLNVQLVTKNNAIQSTSGNQPIYKSNVLNGLPVIRFNDGSNGATNHLIFDGLALVATDYTIFVVEQRRNSNSSNYFLGGTAGATPNANLTLGYRDDTTITHDQWGNGYDMAPAIASYSSPIPRIHTFKSSSAIGKNYYLNGNNFLFPTTNSKNNTAQLVSYSGAAIARYSLGYYQGDIAEIIVFGRALKIEERQSVEDYLGKKWGIQVTH
jgi:prepilin-type N-terminal cleavage/methylation domain-containing protein